MLFLEVGQDVSRGEVKIDEVTHHLLVSYDHTKWTQTGFLRSSQVRGVKKAAASYPSRGGFIRLKHQSRVERADEDESSAL